MDATEKKLKIWELLVRGVATALVALLVGILGYYGNQRLGELQNEAKNAELRQARLTALTQIANTQKDLETNIATKLWEELMTEFFPRDDGTDGRDPLAQQMFRLRLTALNLQDIAVNLKPFFEHLDDELKKREDEAGRSQLRDYAKQVARRQAYRLAFEAGSDFGTRSFEIGKPEDIPVPTPFGVFPQIEIENVFHDSVIVSITSPGQRKIGPFEVSYFDMPLLDNLKLKAAKSRLALLLIDTDPGKNKATLRLVSFQPYMAVDRFDLKEQAQNIGMEKFLLQERARELQPGSPKPE
jgi:hypothetical protein